MPTLQELCDSGKVDMSQDFLSQSEVDALLKGVTGEDDEAASEYDWAEAMGESAKAYPRTTLLNIAERELAYWTGVVHALTGNVKAHNVKCAS